MEGIMALAIQSHVIALTNDPLEAVIEGSHYKAYLVANLAFNDGAEASAKHYNLTLGQVYSAMAFYHDNDAAIKLRFAELEEIGRKIGAVNASEHLAMIRERAKKKQE
jgi:uncharacterized protein (DUF433 family)